MVVSLRSLAASGLAAFALVGCTEPLIVRRGDEDAGAPDAGENALMCNDRLCTPTQTGFVPLTPCCDEFAAGACGATVPPILRSPLSGCHAKAQPGAASQGCGAFLDQLDRLIPTGAVPGVSDLAGCCTPTGLCGVIVDDFFLQGMSLQLGLGCVPIGRLQVPAELDGGTSAEPPTLFPFCVPALPDKSACPPQLAFTVAGQEVDVCAELAQVGLPLIGCDPTAQTPLWVCAAQGLPAIDSADGLPPSDVGDCLEYLPEFVRGCGVDTQGVSCIAHVEASSHGCVDVDSLPTEAQAAVLATVSEVLCGCGDGVSGTGWNCIPNVGETLCGSKPAVVDTRGTPTTDDDCLVDLPEYVRGCGEDGVPDAANICVRHAPQIYGCVEFTGSAAPGVPEFLCGCGDGVAVSGCLANVPTTACGAVDVTSGPLPGFPNALCGCGDGQGGKSCIRNVTATICGAVARCFEGEAGSQSGDATHCAADELCADVTGSGGASGNPPGDDIGDSCISSS